LKRFDHGDLNLDTSKFKETSTANIAVVIWKILGIKIDKMDLGCSGYTE